MNDVREPDLDAITERDLRDDDRLKTLYVRAVRRGFWTNNARDALEFFCLAEKALQDDAQQTPGKLFYALIKQKRREFVTQDIENRAMLRLPSHERPILVDQAARARDLPAPIPKTVQETFFGRDVGYHHGIMAQCFLPQKPLPAGTTRYVTSHGRASMAVRAGILADPQSPNTFAECAVPFGAGARLIVPYIIGHAVVRKSREIDLGRSLRRFLAALGVPYGGQNGRMITEQIRNIAAAEFVLGEWSEEVQRTHKASVAKEISFWAERDPEERRRSLWTPKIVLSEEFYQAIQSRRVPIDMGHLVQLTRSPRRMDLYTWLAYRLPALPPSAPLCIPLRYLHSIFAPDIGVAHSRLFKSRLLRDLEAIRAVYPGFNIDVEGDAVRLRHSAPPVPAKVARLA